MSTYTKSQLPKMSFSALTWGKQVDANGNGYVSKREAATPIPNRGADQVRAFAAFHKQALAALHRQDAASPGQLYAYAKTLLDQMRVVMDTKGNKDHQLQPSELKYLKAGAKLLLKFFHTIEGPPRRVSKPAQPRPKPA